MRALNSESNELHQDYEARYGKLAAHGQPGMTDDTYGLEAETWDRGDGQPDARLLEEALHRILQISARPKGGLERAAPGCAPDAPDRGGGRHAVY